MIIRLPLVLIALLTCCFSGGAPLQAATVIAPKAPPREVRFFLLGDVPALALAEGTRRTPVEATPYALSAPVVFRGSKLSLYAAGAQSEADTPLLVVTPPADAEQLVVVLGAGASPTEPVRVVNFIDLSPRVLPIGQVRVANLLPVDLALMLGREQASLAPRASRVFTPALDENASCPLKVAYANPRSEGYLRLKEGGVYLPASTRMLALAVLTNRVPSAGPKPEWLVYRL